MIYYFQVNVAMIYYFHFNKVGAVACVSSRIDCLRRNFLRIQCDNAYLSDHTICYKEGRVIHGMVFLCLLRYNCFFLLSRIIQKNSRVRRVDRSAYLVAYLNVVLLPQYCL